MTDCKTDPPTTAMMVAFLSACVPRLVTLGLHMAVTCRPPHRAQLSHLVPLHSRDKCLLFVKRKQPFSRCRTVLQSLGEIPEAQPSGPRLSMRRNTYLLSASVVVVSATAVATRGLCLSALSMSLRQRTMPSVTGGILSRHSTSLFKTLAAHPPGMVNARLPYGCTPGPYWPVSSYAT
ncbi:unnamed protein product, partial [Ixodes persulcatus]